MNTNTLSNAANTYANELAAEIVARGNPAGDLGKEIERAHFRLQRTWTELADCETERSQDFRRRVRTEVSA